MKFKLARNWLMTPHHQSVNRELLPTPSSFPRRRESRTGATTPQRLRTPARGIVSRGTSLAPARGTIVILIQAWCFARPLFTARVPVPTWIGFVLPLDSRLRGNDDAVAPQRLDSSVLAQVTPIPPENPLDGTAGMVRIERNRANPGDDG